MKLIMCLLVFFSGSYPANDPSVGSVRLKFHNSMSSERICKALITQLGPYNEKNNPLLMGYRAGATMLMAKHSLNPFNKLSYFKKGKTMLEKAIQAENNNVELRFLRYTIQTNVPSFLGYSSELIKDRSFLQQSVAGVRDAELKKIITAYLKEKS